MARQKYWQRYWALLRTFHAFHETSQSAYETHLRSIGTDGVSWLDAGCGRHPLPPWSIHIGESIIAHASIAVGSDREFASLKDNRTLHLRVQAELSALPFRTQSFSLVTLNMVVEHLPDPKEVFQEVARVTAEDGALLIHTPNRDAWDTVIARFLPQTIKNRLVRFLEQRSDQDIFPAVYRANRIRELRGLLEPCGLELETASTVVTPPRFIPIPLLFLPLTLLAILETKLLRLRVFERFRHNIVAVFRKTGPHPTAPSTPETPPIPDPPPPPPRSPFSV